MITLKDSTQYPVKPETTALTELVYTVDEFEDAGVAYFDYGDRKWKDPLGQILNIDFKWFSKPKKVRYDD